MGEKETFEKETFGVLWPYLVKEEITDIDYNGSQLWITYENGYRKKEPLKLSEDFLKGFTQRIANGQMKSFNPVEPLLEAETEQYRISILHEAVTGTGRNISIRKSLPKLRYSRERAVSSGLMEEEVYLLLTNCVKAHLNLVFCGGPGVGKTECAKFFASQIPAEERVITIEDNLEWHLKQIHPEADVVEMKVKLEESGKFSYKDGIRAALRMNPQWLMVSEARGEEARQLIGAWSTGVSGITTLHTDDVSKIPERILYMMGEYENAPRLEGEVYQHIDVGVLLAKCTDHQQQGVRRVEQVAFFYREKGKNVCHAVWEDGHLVTHQLPKEVIRKMKRYGIVEPWGEGGTGNEE